MKSFVLVSIRIPPEMYEKLDNYRSKPNPQKMSINALVVKILSDWLEGVSDEENAN